MIDGGPPPRRPAAAGERVRDVDIAERMEQAFLDYSMSVIVGRALPDVRDGLKPVQRRILFAMWEAGLRPERPYRKCASAVGDVMKKYHPHGDSSIYDALVRMAQDFSTRVPLVDGHGNFGSVDGDPPAAMRYTEARLSAAAMELLAGIDEGTVDVIPNYDGYETEPVVLPSRLPNLLVNGASGIAVGMATNIPPHNLGEIVDACLHLLSRPGATVDELMRLVPGPDFPTGGRILDTAGIRDAYLTGRGAVTIEAVATTETRSGGLPRIVVTEIPYQVNKAALLERIADLVKERKVEAIRDLRDESSRDGMRVVVELKRGEDPARVLDRLYALTDLRTNFNVNAVALVSPEPGDPAQPRTVGLREALVAYLAHQRTVLTRRTTHRRSKAAARAHVLEGLLVALDHLDEVIALIRASATADEARAELVERFTLTDVQATAVLDMMLRRLAALERHRIAEEHAELLALIAELDAILTDPAKLDLLLADELRGVKGRHADPRRSRIAGVGEPVGGGEGTIQALPQLEAQPVTVSVTTAGVCQSVPRRRTPKPRATARDPLVALLDATTDDALLVVDAEGGGYRIPVADLPVTTPRQRGTSLTDLLGDPPGAPLAGAVVLRPDVATVVTVSAGGLVKRSDRSEYEGRTRAMIAAGVRDDDAIVVVAGCGEDDHLLVASDAGLVIRFPASDVRPMGRGATGVAGLRLGPGARVVALSVVPGGADSEHEVLTLAADGGARRTPLAEYPTKGRGGTGLRTGTSALAWCGVAGAVAVPTGSEAVVVETASVPDGRRSGRLVPTVPPPVAPVVPHVATAGS
ncbi:MAG: DNA topoisomerase 4 subunit A [Euzebyales bacterium]|nr:DNA topoisomerase 4 subunit A [Euzebyales bacterium]MBA3620952.1 DNA topoisomerase 4 subunit A [Euzebyales bacterium]